MSTRPALPGRLLAVTDRRRAAEPLPDLCEAMLAAGLRWLWLRDRDLPPAERRALARDLAARAARRGATLTVGADVALAAEVGAGVHLGAGAEGTAGAEGAAGAARRLLGPRALIGVSAHSVEEVRAARDGGADYATLSPIFPTASKPGYGPALGLDALRAAAATGLPVLALGGVAPATALACRGAGAAGAAVMGEAMRGGAAFVAGWPAEAL